MTLAGYKRHLRAGAAPGPLSRKDHEDDADTYVADTYVEDDVVADDGHEDDGVADTYVDVAYANDGVTYVDDSVDVDRPLSGRRRR